MSPRPTDPERPAARYRALFATVAVGFFFVAAIVTFYFPRRERLAIEQSMQLKALEGARLSAHSVAPALDFDDRILASEVLGRSRVDSELLWVAAYGPDGSRYASDGPAPERVPGAGEAVSLRDDGVFAITPVDLAEGQGHVAALYSTNRVRSAARESERVGLTVAAVILLIGLLLGGVVARTVQHQELLLIENRRARLAAEAASAARLAFLASVSHELRTPLNGVLGLSEALGLEFPDGRAHWFSNAIRRSGATLLALVNDVLDFSKAESGDLQLEAVPFSLEACIAQAVEVIAPVVLSKRLDFVVDVDPKLPRSLVGDALRIQQILNNLLSNAAKFTDEGYVSLTVEVTLTGDRADLCFEVRDTGIGMTPAQLEGIFDAFVQADPSITRRFGGTGLGLAISKQLATHMGGTLRVESEAHVGTTLQLRMTLPVTDPEPCVSLDLTGMRIALADSDPRRTRGLRRPLEAWGATVIEGAELLTTAKRKVGPDEQEQASVDLLVVTQRLDEECDARSIQLMDRFPTTRALVLTPDPGRLNRRQTWLPYPLRLQRLHRALSGGCATEEAPALDTSATGPIGAGARLLIAEDHETNRQVAQLLLERLGFRCEFAHDGAQALAMRQATAAGSEGYIAVLMDVQMPVMDGLNATRAIRQWEVAQQQPRIPIFGLSAHALAEERAKGLDAGMDLFLTKPVTSEALRRALEPYVELLDPKEPRAAQEPLRATAAAAPRASLPQPPEEVLNQASVKMLLGLSDARVTSKIISEFMTDTQRRLQVLRAAAESDDREEVGRIAHGVKGACWSLGLAALGDALQALDQSSREAARPVDLALMDSVDRELARATLALEWLLALCADSVATTERARA
ncbi:MAG: response regulator [Myxococcales bacterium]|nr:response regulator [Myxococcales bacterium]MCB9626635.1 response regulator [Sandaracinaceae bacterium]